MPDRAYVKATGSAAASLLAAVRSQHARAAPVSAWTAAVSDQQAKQNQVGMELLLGIAIAYSAIGIAGTFLMSVAGRAPELALPHTIGAIRRQVVWFVAAESLALTGEAGPVSVVLPWPLLGAILAGCVVIAVLTSALPAWLRSGRPD